MVEQGVARRCCARVLCAAGIFEPLRINGRWLFDGALVNPIPVTVCRVLGADFVIAIISMPTFAALQHRRKPSRKRHWATTRKRRTGHATDKRLSSAAAQPGHLFRRQFARGDNGAPGIATAMVDAFNITQDRIARSRLAGDPPDFSIAPRLTGIGFFDFHRAADMIALGREATRKCLGKSGNWWNSPKPRSRCRDIFLQSLLFFFQLRKTMLIRSPIDTIPESRPFSTIGM